MCVLADYLLNSGSSMLRSRVTEKSSRAIGRVKVSENMLKDGAMMPLKSKPLASRGTVGMTKKTFPNKKKEKKENEVHIISSQVPRC